MNFSKLNALLNYLCQNDIIPALQVVLKIDGQTVYTGVFGSIRESHTIVSPETQFDIASLTKLFSGILFMQLIEEGKFKLDDPICVNLPNFSGVRTIEKNGQVLGQCNIEDVTWRQALTHTTGMGWTRPKTRPSLPHLGEGVHEIYKLPFAYFPGTKVAYSDIPIILMGSAIEKITAVPLDTLLHERLCKPLGLIHTGYHRLSLHEINQARTVPTEYDTVFRKRRVWGDVHDENCYLMDGVSAHAGIFSTAEDVCRLMAHYADCLKSDGILKRKTAQEMISLQAEDSDDRRGLIWQLSSQIPSSYTYALSNESYGHSGFTGCFAWNDPTRKLSIVFLSNDIYNGRENRQLFSWRKAIITAILDELAP